MAQVFKNPLAQSDAMLKEKQSKMNDFDLFKSIHRSPSDLGRPNYLEGEEEKMWNELNKHFDLPKYEPNKYGFTINDKDKMVNLMINGVLDGRGFGGWKVKPQDLGPLKRRVDNGLEKSPLTRKLTPTGRQVDVDEWEYDDVDADYERAWGPVNTPEKYKQYQDWKANGDSFDFMDNKQPNPATQVKGYDQATYGKIMADMSDLYNAGYKDKERLDYLLKKYKGKEELVKYAISKFAE